MSTIIPTYNRANLVSEAIESVLKQTYPKLEVIVVDDGSTDDTQAQLKRYGNRIRVVIQDNAGPASARNRGIAVSGGDLITFLDSDDLWLPTKVERQVAALQKVSQSVPCCLCNTTMRRSGKAFTSFEVAWLNPALDEGIWLNVDEVLATRFVLFNQGIAIRREVLARIGGFDESLWLLEDHELSLRLSLEGPWAFVREPLVVWRETMGSCYQKARKDAICSRENRPEGTSNVHCALPDNPDPSPMIRILERHLAKLKDAQQPKSLQKHLSRALKRIRRHARVAKMSQMNSWGPSILGKSLRRLEQCRSAAFRRSPWFPKMKSESLDRWGSHDSE